MPASRKPYLQEMSMEELPLQQRGFDAVDLVTDDRVADGREMYPYLVGPAGLNASLQQ